jgi:hypothetical protein
MTYNTARNLIIMSDTNFDLADGVVVVGKRSRWVIAKKKKEGKRGG